MVIRAREDWYERVKEENDAGNRKRWKYLFTVLYKFECENLVSSDPNLTPSSSFITFPFFW